MFRQFRPAAPGGVGHAFTDAEHTFGRTADVGVAPVRLGIDAVLAAAGVERCYAVQQVHSAEVVIVDRAEAARYDTADGYLGSLIPGRPSLRVADALVTDQPGIALLIRTADCLPVVLTDATAAVIGVAHAGRVGLAAGVLPATVRAMRELGARTISAVIGPAVCGDCYEVPAAMQAAVAEQVPGKSRHHELGDTESGSAERRCGPVGGARLRGAEAGRVHLHRPRFALPPA